MAYLNRQQLFDNAWNGLKSQGFVQCANDEGDCKYRGDNGMRCGIGWSIPDERYSRSLEGRGVEERVVLLAASIRPFNQDFAGDLQNCHDNSYSPADMQARFIALAEKHRLTIPGESAAKATP